ncbi:MAG: hypothetical protein ABI145_17875 [Steroidobacteraceae bacterium]
MQSTKTPSRYRYALVSLITLVCIGCVESDAQRAAASERTMRRTKEALIAAGDADSLAAAAMFVAWSRDAAPPQRLALISRAVAAAPNRADLVWLNLQICSQVDSCDPNPLEARLHVLDPPNAAAWSLSIVRSAKLHDTAAVRKDILAIANSERFDIYWNAMIVRTTDAVLKVHTLDPRTALVTTIGFVAATAIPAYQQISNACKGDHLKDPDVVQTCQRVASVMRQGDTYITEMIGAAIAKRVWPEGSAEYLDAVGARRLGRYRMETENKTSIARIGSSKYAEKHLHLLATHRTEQEVVLAEILDAGLNPTPPTDWTDKIG